MANDVDTGQSESDDEDENEGTSLQKSDLKIRMDEGMSDQLHKGTPRKHERTKSDKKATTTDKTKPIYDERANHD